MKKCNNCGNITKLIVSTRQSAIIKDAHYVSCLDCGNVMLMVNNKIIPTPTSNTPQTKLLIQDAANCFDALMVNGVASLDGKTTPTDIQPSQVLQELQDYVDYYIYHGDEEDLDECDCCNECCSCVCDQDSACTCQELAICEEEKITVNTTVNKDYLLISSSGEKQVYQNCSKDFMINIINDIGTDFSLFELKPVELKSKVKYTF